MQRNRDPAEAGVLPRTAVQLDLPAAGVGESPMWFRNYWWWVDAAAGDLFRASGSIADQPVVERVFAAGERLSLVLPATGGSTVIAVGGSLIAIAEGVPPQPWTTVSVPDEMLLNDGIVDQHGNVLLGSVDPGGRAVGELIRIGPDRHQKVVSGGFMMSNGMAVEPVDGLLHADSGARRIVRHRFNADGTLRESVTHLTFSEDEGMPDGLEADADGGLWVALYGSGQVRHYSASGQLDDIVELPAAQVTNVALGGPDGHDMLITTADERTETTPADPLAGRLFSARARTSAARRHPVRL